MRLQKKILKVENFVKNKIMKPKKDLDVALFMLVELQIWEIHLMNIFVII